MKLKKVKMAPRLVRRAPDAARACLGRVERKRVREFREMIGPDPDTINIPVRIAFSWSSTGAIESIRFDEDCTTRQAPTDGIVWVNPLRPADYEVSRMVEAAYELYIDVMNKRRNPGRPLFDLSDDELESLTSASGISSGDVWSDEAIAARVLRHHAEREAEARIDESNHDMLRRLAAIAKREPAT